MTQPVQSRHISADGFPSDVTRDLMRWLIAAGVDEFTLTAMGIHGEIAVGADALEDAIEPFVLGIERRRVLTDADGQGLPRHLRMNGSDTEK